MNRKVTIGQILTVALSLTTGVISVLIFQNYLQPEKIEFNTLGLIGFVFSIVFGGASIVLAITAINLGKSSEKIMIDRSERSIELQTEIFMKTTEALRKIESSTGVTEKRIEDIIAGRVGDIANKLVDDRLVTTKDKGKLEKELRKSLSRDLSEEEKLQRELQKQEDEKVRIKYREFKDDVLLRITNDPKSKAFKIGDGSYNESGADLVDGLFEIGGIKIALCVFYSHPFYESIFGTDIDKFLNDIAEEISAKTFQKIYLIFNEESIITERFNKEIDKIKNLYKADISSNIELLTGSSEIISTKIINYVP